jgi:acid stress chaperone HdeA
MALICLVLGAAAMADSPATPASAKMTSKTEAATKTTKVVKPATMSCADFLAVDEVTRPDVVYWSEGVNSKGKPEEGVLDIDRTTRLVPVLVEDCQKEPKTPFWTKVKEDIKKVF